MDCRGSRHKKLIDAGWHWAGAGFPARGTDPAGTAAIDDAEYYGVSRRITDAFRARHETAPQERFFVWPENETAIRVFLEVCDQWRYPPLGGLPLGLDAAVVFQWLALSGRQRRARQLWPQLRLIASGAMACWQAQQQEQDDDDDSIGDTG
ncbi:MAG: DUF1799 domain-containing protein [Thiothrix sp.]|nr:DUF1799 domain-containing protein [Thiothrix sp.]